MQHKPLPIGEILLTCRPSNPIYENLQNPFRSDYGTGVEDVIGIFKSISVIGKTNPRISLVRNDVLKRTNNFLRMRIEKGLRIAVSPFLDNLNFQIGSLVESWPSDQKTPFWFKRIVDIHFAKARLIQLLEASLDKAIAVLVLPESTVDQELLETAKGWLKEVNRDRAASGNDGILLLVAGNGFFVVIPANRHGTRGHNES